VALSQDERWLAVTHRDSPTSPAGLVMHEITDAVVGDANTVSLPADLVAGSDEVTYAGWSPDGTTLAIAVRDSRQLGFFQWTGDELLQVGNLVPIDEGTFGGVWSPDSRFFYTNNVRGASRPELPSDPAELISTLQTVQVAPVDDPQPAHSVIQTTPTTIFTEGVAASPDGRLFAAVSMQTTALPTSNALFNPTSVVSLYTRDQETGMLTKVGDYPFEGILPEGVDFDPTSTRLAVATYQNATDRTVGSVDLWKVTTDAAGATSLTVDARLPAPRGVHHVEWIE
jgi:hypothetical protein